MEPFRDRRTKVGFICTCVQLTQHANDDYIKVPKEKYTLKEVPNHQNIT